MRYNNMVFRRMHSNAATGTYDVATYKGIALKTIFFLALTVLGAVGGILLAITNPTIYYALLAVGGIATFIFAIISMLSVRACKVTGTLYCLFEGLSIGLVSLLCATILEGSVTIAILSTITVFAVVTLLFVSNIVKVNSGFVKFLMIFAISYMVTVLLFSILSFTKTFELNFGITLLLSAVSTFIATLYLFFDLEQIRQTVEGNYPKEYEWMASFGISFTLIWLYVEILRLVVIVFARHDN